MSVRRNAVALLATCLCVAGPAWAQVRVEAQAPSQVIDDLTQPVASFQLPPVDAAALLADNAERGKAGAFRWGIEIPLELDLKQLGTRDALPDGGSVWRLQLDTLGALAVALGFSEFDLPQGAGLWVHAADGSQTYGAFTALNNKADRQFAVLPMPGQSVLIEYVEPGWVERPGVVVIDEVIHGVVDVLDDKDGSWSGSGGCNVDVNCAAGAAFQDEKRAVARIFSGGYLCTGSLINNSNNDGTQLFWTASHCGGMNNAVFLFNYESSGCGSGGAPTNQSVQGSVLIANNSSVDYRLVRLTQTIPDNYDVYFLGWNRSSSNPSNTITIHHPSGDRKKISFDDDAATKSGTDWRIAQWDLGVTEGGSSGAPLLDPQGRFIGQLCCGQAYCGYPYNDYYGRFDLAWSGVSSTLDPAGSGATTLAGFDPDDGGGPVGSWTALGGGLAALVGTPVLAGSGTQVAGSPTTLTLGAARPNAAATLVVGLSALNAPFKGGTLVPALNATVALNTNFLGGIVVQDNWPAGIPASTSIWYQYWITDNSGPQGFSASNAVRSDSP